MHQLIQYFTGPLQKDSLHLQEKTRQLTIAALLAIPSMLIGLSLHLYDHKPVPVIQADAVFLTASIFTLFLIKRKKSEHAGRLFILSLLYMILFHNLVTDYLYEQYLSYYRLVETAMIFVLIILSVALILQQRGALLFSAVIGEGCILLHYLIVAEKMNFHPLDFHPFSILIAYMLIFLIVYITIERILRTYDRLLNTAEEESNKVKVYNQELERRVQERTQTLEQQNQELKKVNGELDRFVYSASHDLRAPLTSVLGLISLARIEDDPEQIRHYLELKEKSIRKLDTFIQDIVNISKNARTEIRRDKVFFCQLVEEIFTQYDYLENSELISKHINIQQDTAFCTDKPRLNIILNNLLSNAIRYAVPHRVAAFIKVNGRISEKEAVLEIEDNGRGIATEHLDKIFEMFFRTDNSTTGSGLGLYIVKETLDKLGGQISVSSTLGKGTIFTVKIPSEVPCHSLSTT